MYLKYVLINVSRFQASIVGDILREHEKSEKVIAAICAGKVFSTHLLIFVLTKDIA